MSFVPSIQQSAVIEFVKNGKGSAFVEAVAGAGKTTTLIEALKQTQGSVAFAAFNKKIADEIKSKIHKQIRDGLAPADLAKRVRVGTFHSFGSGAWNYVHKDVKTDALGKRDATRAQLLKVGCDESLFGIIETLVGLAKQRVMGVIGSIDDEALWWDIVNHYDLAHEIEDEELLPTAIDYARRALNYHIRIADKIIDFDDMLYMPVKSGVRMWGNDWVFVDEAQDTNPARRALARKMLLPQGRSVWVGDSRQGIYGFSGADSDAIDRIVTEFKCSRLPLTITYRCPKLVVEQARTIVSHIEAHETAPEGSVVSLDFQAFTKSNFNPTDAILCRNTKPLVQTAYSLIRRGVACHVEGKDIGRGMLKLVNKYRARSLDQLIDKLTKYRDRETEKMIAKGKETQAEALADRVETVFVLADGCKTVEDLTHKISMMFQDSDDESKPSLTLSTVHKSKGREWSRVFILGHATLMPSRFARQEWQIEQEDNLKYVAYTRAQEELVLVSGHE